MKLKTVTALLLSASCLATSTGFCQGLTTEEPPAASKKTATLSSTSKPKEVGDTKSTPEVAMKKFMIAMISGDLKKLKLVTHPLQDIELLVPNITPPKEAVKQMEAMFEAIPISTLKVGDTFKIPGGQSSITLDESHINENKTMLTFPNNPFPFPAARIDGVWKIDPTNILKVRKAAMKIREEQKNALDKNPKAVPLQK